MNAHRLLQAMAIDHQGAANGITARALAQQLECGERQVRKMVTSLREEGVAVCGRPDTGYFIAESLEELHATVQFLMNRAKHSMWQATRLMNIPAADLAGQRRLPT